MSTYPATLDDLGATNPSSSDAMNDGDGHAAQHAAANDAIDAIQATLGAGFPSAAGEPDGHVLTVDTGAWTAAAPTGGSGGSSVGGDLYLATNYV